MTLLQIGIVVGGIVLILFVIGLIFGPAVVLEAIGGVIDGLSDIDWFD